MRGRGVTFSFDGEPIEASDDQTIAAALIASGRRVFRRTRGEGEPRGLFCGIGVCFDCLVVLNGRRRVRSCMTPAREGDVVTTLEGAGDADSIRAVG